VKIMVINPNTSSAMTEGIRRTVMAVKRPDTELTVLCPDEGPIALESDFDRAFAVPPMLELVQQANQQGYDAVIIAAFCDPGLKAAREISDILVLGIEEATLHVAAMLGAKFTILTTSSKNIANKEAEVRRYMLEAALASVRPLGLSVLQTAEEPELTKKRAIEVLEKAAEEDGAEVAILGCAGMAGYADEISKKLGLAVLDPTSVTLKVCEAMVEAGLVHSKRAMFAKPAEKEFKRKK
jgi:allantoin racemase